MEKLIEDLIQRLQKTKDCDALKAKKSKEINEEKMAFLFSGKTLAYDFCINELERVLSYFRKSDSPQKS